MRTRCCEATRLAVDWLERFVPANCEQEIYQTNGLAAVRKIRTEAPTELKLLHQEMLPPFEEVAGLVTASREELIRYCDESLSRTTINPIVLRLEGYLAESHARTDDLQVVASLLALVSVGGYIHHAIEDCVRFVLDQQQDDGSFGLIAPELEMLGCRHDSTTPRLIMTIEVLRALCKYESAFVGAAHLS